MRKFEQPAIGSIVLYKDRILKVCEVESPVCNGCLFSSEKEGFGSRFSCRDISLGCTPYQREDRKHVIFKPISPLVVGKLL